MWPVEAVPDSWASWMVCSAASQLTFRLLPACGPGVQLLLDLFSTAPGIVLPLGLSFPVALLVKDSGLPGP